MDQECRLSVVVTSRNDDHGGDMLRRFRLFAENLIGQAERHGLTGELVVVEWNPPKGPRLPEALKLRVASDSFPVRFIEVPLELHAALPNADVIPLFQMIAKNVGIRRARGRFVLATNPDLIFSEELVRFLATEDLDPRGMYRIDRTDVESTVPDADIDAQLDWCRHHVLRIHGRWGTFRAGGTAAVGRRLLGAPGDVMRWLVRSGSILNVLREGAAGALRQVLRLTNAAYNMVDTRPKIHTNGCGDFTLLSREAWVELRAYPELPLWSMHLDSLLCYMAAADGYREHLVHPPAGLYHMEHGRSWVVMDPEARLRTFARTPWLDTSLLDEVWIAMAREGRAMVYNDEDWGLGCHPLQETTFSKSGEAHTTAPAPPATENVMRGVA